METSNIAQSGDCVVPTGPKTLSEALMDIRLMPPLVWPASPPSSGSETSNGSDEVFETCYVPKRIVTTSGRLCVLDYSSSEGEVDPTIPRSTFPILPVVAPPEIYSRNSGFDDVGLDADDENDGAVPQRHRSLLQEFSDIVSGDGDIFGYSMDLLPPLGLPLAPLPFVANKPWHAPLLHSCGMTAMEHSDENDDRNAPFKRLISTRVKRARRKRRMGGYETVGLTGGFTALSPDPLRISDHVSESSDNASYLDEDVDQEAPFVEDGLMEFMPSTVAEALQSPQIQGQLQTLLRDALLSDEVQDQLAAVTRLVKAQMMTDALRRGDQSSQEAKLQQTLLQYIHDVLSSEEVQKRLLRESRFLGLVQPEVMQKEIQSALHSQLQSILHSMRHIGLSLSVSDPSPPSLSNVPTFARNPVRALTTTPLPVEVDDIDEADVDEGFRGLKRGEMPEVDLNAILESHLTPHVRQVLDAQELSDEDQVPDETPSAPPLPSIIQELADHIESVTSPFRSDDFPHSTERVQFRPDVLSAKADVPVDTSGLSKKQRQKLRKQQQAAQEQQQQQPPPQFKKEVDIPAVSTLLRSAGSAPTAVAERTTGSPSNPIDTMRASRTESGHIKPSSSLLGNFLSSYHLGLLSLGINGTHRNTTSEQSVLLQQIFTQQQPSLSETATALSSSAPVPASVLTEPLISLPREEHGRQLETGALQALEQWFSGSVPPTPQIKRINSQESDARSLQIMHSLLAAGAAVGEGAFRSSTDTMVTSLVVDIGMLTYMIVVGDDTQFLRIVSCCPIDLEHPGADMVLAREAGAVRDGQIIREHKSNYNELVRTAAHSPAAIVQLAAGGGSTGAESTFGDGYFAQTHPTASRAAQPSQPIRLPVAVAHALDIMLSTGSVAGMTTGLVGATAVGSITGQDWPHVQYLVHFQITDGKVYCPVFIAKDGLDPLLNRFEGMAVADVIRSAMRQNDAISARLAALAQLPQEQMTVVQPIAKPPPKPVTVVSTNPDGSTAARVSIVPIIHPPQVKDQLERSLSISPLTHSGKIRRDTSTGLPTPPPSWSPLGDGRGALARFAKEMGLLINEAVLPPLIETSSSEEEEEDKSPSG